MDWIAAVIILLGNIIIVKIQNWKVFLIFLTGNLIYSYWWYLHRQWPTMLLTSVFVLQNLWGIYEWKKNKK